MNGRAALESQSRRQPKSLYTRAVCEIPNATQAKAPRAMRMARRRQAPLKATSTTHAYLNPPIPGGIDELANQSHVDVKSPPGGLNERRGAKHL